MGKRREILGELYELCDNSSYNCSSVAESTVCDETPCTRICIIPFGFVISGVGVHAKIPHGNKRRKHIYSNNNRLIINNTVIINYTES